MFADAHFFNQPLNKWNVSKVTEMEGMFYHARSFNQPLNNWNVSTETGQYWRRFEFSPYSALRDL